MGSKNEMTRKEFLTLTFTLVGAAAVGACSSDNNNSDGGVGGHGGTTGSAGHGGNGGGAGGNAGTGGGGGTTAAACADPLPENQSASDHTHTVTIHPSVLNSTTAQTFDTSSQLSHMHMVTLQPADLATLKGGGTVTITSSAAGSGPHTHDYTISCH